MAHRNGLAPQFGMVALLHRGVEGVHVDVYNLALVHKPVPQAACPAGRAMPRFTLILRYT